MHGVSRIGTRVMVMPTAGKRVLLLGVAVLLSLSALLAIAILLAGHFGSVERRILASTMLLAAYGFVALPAAMLFDKARARVLASAAAAFPAVAAALALFLTWSRSDSETLGRMLGTATIISLALAQLAAMTARQGARDPILLRRLFALSCGTGVFAGACAVTLLWAGPDSQRGARFLGALLVLDLLLVALQPVLVRARAGAVVRRITVVLDSGEQSEIDVEASDLASAAARAIRSIERTGGSVIELRIAAEAGSAVGTSENVDPRSPDAAERARGARASLVGAAAEVPPRPSIDPLVRDRRVAATLTEQERR